MIESIVAHVLEVSSLNLKERSQIAASIKRFNPKYNCDALKQELNAKIDRLRQRNADAFLIEQQIESNNQKIKLSCSSPLQIKSGEFSFNKCLCNFRDDSFHDLMTYYHQYDKGNLPFPGSLSEQPAQIIEAFEYIQSLIEEVREEISKEEEKKSKGSKNVR